VVVCDDYVTADSGTGIVHLAPYFGEDDNRVCLAAGIIQKEGSQSHWEKGGRAYTWVSVPDQYGPGYSIKRMCVRICT